MSKALIPLVIESPGFLGLNSQNSGSVLPVGWASVLENVVWDDVGRLASRKGSQKVHANAITNTPKIRSMFEYVNATGTPLNIFAADNKIFKEASGTITDISGSITTPTGDDWQFQNFNGTVVGFQTGHPPITLTTVAGTFIDATGTQFNGDAVLSAWGRIWTVFQNDLYHSDLLINNFTGGSSGSFDLARYWPNGQDQAVALADFNGFLVVFGKNSIIVYENPDDPTVMAIVEGVDGDGCIARDSVQVIGRDLVFLSNSGLKALSRTIQEKSMPLTDISKNIRDEMLAIVGGETNVQIKSAYNSRDGFYMLSLPVAGVSFIFDLKFPNEDGSLKVARWNFAPTALSYTEALKMNMGVTAGFYSRYQDFKDEKLSDGTGGSVYLMDFEGVWNDFGEEVSPLLKMLKRVSVIASGVPGGTVTLKWSVDYSNVFESKVLSFSEQDPARFGIALFNTVGTTFASFGDFESIKSSISRAGQVVKVGLSATIFGSNFAIQRINLLAKIGKIGI